MKTCGECAYLMQKGGGRYVCSNKNAHPILRRIERHLSDKACGYIRREQARMGREADNGSEK